MQLSGAASRGREKTVLLNEEAEKRYLAYALSTIVSRALPDVRDGLKPVHRRILYAMHSLGLSDAAKMRKSAAVVGEVIGKYHPHGDQAAYEALVRMAQDFSLRYPLIEGSGNFGSVDGDSPAAMRYTEARLSSFAGMLLREIEQGTTGFRPTYDGVGEEPDILPALVPNLLLNGSSGIAVGMSCSFAPHQISEVMAACRALIRNRSMDSAGLMKYIKGPDFPTGGEILDQPTVLAAIYAQGHGSIRLRGTFQVEKRPRSGENIVVTSIPYSVNKSRLIERMAQLVKDRRLRHVQDIRDESTGDVRIVLELKAGDVKPESVMAFLYKHTDLQINFPVNMIAITPQGVPERLGLAAIIRHFLDFRYEKTRLRLEHTLALLEKRIHVLDGFDLLFQDLDRALKIIRSARSKKEAEDGLKAHFTLDDQQVDAILEMRLYRLVGLEIGKLLDELNDKKRQAQGIVQDLGSPERLWKIVDRELEDAAKKFGDARRTRLVGEREASAIEFNPEEFVEHEDVTVILSKQGWIRRMKAELADASSLKFREGDSLFGWARVNTERTVALLSNLGKMYILRALDIPATSGFGEPVGNLFGLADGEFMVGFVVPDAVRDPRTKGESSPAEDWNDPEDEESEEHQPLLFDELGDKAPVQGPSDHAPMGGILVTRHGKGFRFDYRVLGETTKRSGRRLVNLGSGDEVVIVQPVLGENVVIAADSGHILMFPVDQVPILAGAAGGVRMIKLQEGTRVVAMETLGRDDALRIQSSSGEDKVVSLAKIPLANRGGKGKRVGRGIVGLGLAEQVGEQG